MDRVIQISPPDSVESSISKAEAYASELQDMISLSAVGWGAAYKKGLLIRLELQYALSVLKLEHGAIAHTAGQHERTIDLERALVRLSSHISKARQLCQERAYAGCASELHAADALDSKIIPRLRKEMKG